MIKYSQPMAVIEEDLGKVFHFLVESFGFEKMPEYSFVKEVYNDYWKRNLLIKFIYDGTLRINVSKLNKYEQNILFSESNHKRIISLQNKISVNELKTLYSIKNNFEQQAELIADTLKLNSTMLDGKLRKLNPLYKLIYTIGFKNPKDS